MGDVEEETVAPNWLKELEAKREKRLKTKLGHEAGAGAPCLTCEDKCPGLDLHFWRKICKNCKCSKESHDAHDDDIYGWAQFQLLGSKPNKIKTKITLPGKKDEVELDWTPKGQKDTVEKYLKTLPEGSIPIKGSPAAQERKQMLQKQIPIHDIDPTLCHDLTTDELTQMNEYITNVKEKSVGMGQLINLGNILRGNIHNIGILEAKLLAERFGKNIPISEIVKLQAQSNAQLLQDKQLAHELQKLNVTNKEKILKSYNPKALHNPEDALVDPVYSTIVHDKNYAMYGNVNNQNTQNTLYSKGLTPNKPVDDEVIYANLNFHQTISPPTNEKSLQGVPANIVPLKVPFNEISNSVEYGKSYPVLNQKNLEQHNFANDALLERQNLAGELVNSTDLLPGQYGQTGGLNKLNYGDIGANIEGYLDRSNIPYGLNSSELRSGHFAGQSQNLGKNNQYDPSSPYGSQMDPTSAPIDPYYHKIGHNAQYNDPMVYKSGIPSGQSQDLGEKYDPINELRQHYPKNQLLRGKSGQLDPNNSQNELLGGQNDPNVQYKHDTRSNLGHMNPNDPKEYTSRVMDSQNYPYNTATGEDINNPYKSQSLGLNINKSGELGQLDPNNPHNESLGYKSGNLAVQNDPNVSYKHGRGDLGQIDQNNPQNESLGYKSGNLAGQNDPNVQYKHGRCDLSQIDPNNPKEYKAGLTGGQNYPYNIVNSEGINNPYDKSVSTGLNKNILGENTPSYNDNEPIYENTANLRKNISDNLPNYAPGSHNLYNNEQTGLKIGNLNDLVYSTYDENSIDNTLGEFSPNHNTRLGPGLNNQLPNMIPGYLNQTEDVLYPNHVNIGGIKDIEYPDILTAGYRVNESIENLPKQKQQEIKEILDHVNIPNCHYCKKQFDPEDFVNTIEHSHALFHADCFRCAGCNQKLADNLYVYDTETDNIYCLRDFAKIRGIPRCHACDELIFTKEYCLAENCNFHIKHFCCIECDIPLAGQNYLIENTHPMCLPCYETNKASKCNACLKVIKHDEVGLTLKDVHFHANPNCFCCKVCKKDLSGQKLMIKENQLYCSADCFRTVN